MKFSFLAALLPSFAFSQMVSTAAELESAIIANNAAGSPVTIQFSTSFTYAQQFNPINCDPTFVYAGKTYTIDGDDGVGGRYTLSLTGGTPYRGFFVGGNPTGGTPGGTITIQNLIISGAIAKGGDGATNGGGGGAGMGGGLFVGEGADVVISNVAFMSCEAMGGDGAAGGGNGGGGGGGLFGNGSAGVNSPASGGGGGSFGGSGGTSGGRGGGGGGAKFNGNFGAGGGSFDGSGGGTAGAGGGGPGGDGSTGGGGGGGGAGGDNPGGQGGMGGFGGGGGGVGNTTFSVDVQAAGAGGVFGGGGGGSGGTCTGGDGDFGGGGGGGGSGSSIGGAGGFGGGGGGGNTNGSGGFAGGDAASGGGGGGGALGGAIFIQDGGQLTIQDGVTFSGNTVTEGTGGDPGNNDGEAYGTDIFMMSGSTLILGTGTISSAIQSDQGAGGGSGGGVVKQGTGVFTLSGANTFTESVTFEEGTLSISADNNLGDSGNSLLFDGGTLRNTSSFISSRDITLTGNGTFETEANLTLTTNIAGAGSLIKQGSSALTLTGTSMYTGPTTISAGTLVVNGSIATSSLTTVGGSGTLKGSGGTVGPLTVQGSVTPGESIGTLNIDGDLLLESTSTTTIEINSSGSSSKLVVSGTVTLESGATLVVIAQDGFYTAGTTWTFIESPMLANSQRFTFIPPEFLTSLIVQYNSPMAGYITLFLGGIPTAGLSGNSLSVLNYLNTLFDSPSLEAILIDLMNLSQSSLQDAMIAISPLRVASSNFALINTQFTFTDLLFSRWSGQRALRLFHSFSETASEDFMESRFTPENLTVSAPRCWETEFSDGEIEEEEQILLPAKAKQRREKYSAWAQGFGVFAHEKGRDTNPSFDAMSGGFLTAFDWFGSESAVVGGGVGYAHNTLDQDQNLGKGSSETALATFYASYFYDAFFLDGALWGGYNWIRSSRHVEFPGFNKEAKGKFHSWQLSPHLDFGYSFLFSWAAIEPFASFDWPILFTSQLTETGADPLNMQLRAQTSSMLRSELGVNFYQQQMRETGLFIARQTLSYVNKKPFSVGQVTAAIVGDPGSFTVETFQNTQNLFSPTVEFFFKRKDGVFGSIIYIGEFGSGYISNEVLGQVGVYF